MAIAAAGVKSFPSSTHAVASAFYTEVEVVADTGPFASQVLDINDVVVRVIAGDVFHQIEWLGGLRANWDGDDSEAPSSNAIHQAIDALQYVPSFPIRIVPSAEGGVAIHFRRGERAAQIEFTNDYEIIGLTYSPQDAPRAWKISRDDISNAFSQINRYLTG